MSTSGDRAGGSAAVLVGIGPGPVEREDTAWSCLYVELARTCVTGGFRSGTLVLASIVLLFLLSVLPAASIAMLWNA